MFPLSVFQNSRSKSMTGGVANSIAASSVASSSSAVSWKYDVFLSFRGPDTRKGITFELYDRLHNKRGITTFMDDRDLEVGDAISPTLLKAIKESRFAIVVLSPNYASSTWCLEELATICECMKENNRILPLFYYVEPSDVRHRKRSFEEAFNDHERSGRHTSEKVQRWKDALNKVANFSGWDTKNFKTERELVDTIVQQVCTKVQPLEMEFILSTGDFQEFEATRKTRNEVMEALEDDEVTAVGVCGMGGVGKTTMVKHVAAQSCKKGTFHHFIMAVVSQNPDFRNVQDALAEQLGFKFWEETEIGRTARLKKEIMRSEKRLIILDDVWKKTELSKIGIPSYKELQRCKSKILLTTRIRNVCYVMECQRKITLHTLSKEDSWTLFVSKAGRTFESTTFEDVARRVAGECKGLPIALIAVARALGDKDRVEWEKAAQRLEKSQSANPDHDDEGVFNCLRLSYDYLKDEEYKIFFLLGCLFPEDHNIIIEDLFRYAMGIGLFQEAETIYEARGTADTLVKYLINSSLLLESDEIENRCVRMHDVVRDTALNIAKSEGGHRFLVNAGCGLDDWPRRLLSDEGCTAISLMRNGIRKLPSQLECPKLQILSLNRNSGLKEIPETFFQSPNELRVLDLSGTAILLIPQSIGLLTNLRALYLDGCRHLYGCRHLRDISVVGKVTTLEVLSLKGCFNLKILSREIGNLTDLRVLDIASGSSVYIPSELISRLHSLEELYLNSWDSSYAYGGDETNAVFDEIVGLPKLRILHVWIRDINCIPKHVELSPNWAGFCIRFSRDRDLYNGSYESNKYGDTQRTIYLNQYSLGSFPDWFFKAVMNKAETLVCLNCDRSDLIDYFVEYEDGRLHSLKHLDVYGLEMKFKNMRVEDLDTRTRNLVEGWVPKKPVFENLETLRLGFVDLRVVKSLSPGSLFKLKLLHIESCYSWPENVLFLSTLLQSLPNHLEELTCYSMDEIEYVFGYEALLETGQSKLRKINLGGLHSLRKICEGPAPPAMFQNLHSLHIIACNLQGSLFSYDVAARLSQLNYLKLDRCPLLERIVEASNKMIILPKLKQLTLGGLPMLYYESASLDIECPSLEELVLWGCPKFSVSVSDFYSTKQAVRHELDRELSELWE